MMNNLRRYRKMSKLTQKKLAKIVGCRRETIGNIEAGKYNPSLDLAWRIVETLDYFIKDNYSILEFVGMRYVFPNPYVLEEYTRKLMIKEEFRERRGEAPST